MKLDLKVVNSENCRAQLSSFSVQGLPYKQTVETHVAIGLRVRVPQRSCYLEPLKQRLVGKKVDCFLSIDTAYNLIRSTATFLGMCVSKQLEISLCSTRSNCKPGGLALLISSEPSTEFLHVKHIPLPSGSWGRNSTDWL